MHFFEKEKTKQKKPPQKSDIYLTLLRFNGKLKPFMVNLLMDIKSETCFCVIFWFSAMAHSYYTHAEFDKSSEICLNDNIHVLVISE